MKKIILAVMMLALSVPAMADTGGAVLGALVLGALGNQIGGGNGKKIATVAGVMAGASIGSRLEDGTYGKDANGDYVCVNCGNQTAQSQYRSAGEEAAAHRGMSDRRAMEQAAAERNAYCSQNPYGCSRNRGYRGRNYAGGYNTSSNGIQWR